MSPQISICHPQGLQPAGRRSRHAGCGTEVGWNSQIELGCQGIGKWGVFVSAGSGGFYTKQKAHPDALAAIKLKSF